MKKMIMLTACVFLTLGLTPLLADARFVGGGGGSTPPPVPNTPSISSSVRPANTVYCRASSVRLTWQAYVSGGNSYTKSRLYWDNDDSDTAWNSYYQKGYWGDNTNIIYDFPCPIVSSGQNYRVYKLRFLVYNSYKTRQQDITLILYNYNSDTDGDGLSDGVEVLIHTNLNVKDTDGDGYSDYVEKGLASNPLSSSSKPTIYTPSILSSPTNFAYQSVSSTRRFTWKVSLTGRNDLTSAKLYSKHYGYTNFQVISTKGMWLDNSYLVFDVTSPSISTSQGCKKYQFYLEVINHDKSVKSSYIDITYYNYNSDTDGDGISDGNERDGSFSGYVTNLEMVDTDNDDYSDFMEAKYKTNPLSASVKPTINVPMILERPSDFSYNRDTAGTFTLSWKATLAGENYYTESLLLWDTNGDGYYENRIERAQWTDGAPITYTVAEPGLTSTDHFLQYDFIFEVIHRNGKDGKIEAQDRLSIIFYNYLADSDQDGATDGNELDGSLRGYQTKIDDPDTDNDGLNDGDENEHLTNPLNPHSDSDGLTDGVEVNEYGSDPLKMDSDDDGATDGVEVNVFKTHPADKELWDGGLVKVKLIFKPDVVNSIPGNYNPESDGWYRLPRKLYAHLVKHISSAEQYYIEEVKRDKIKIANMDSNNDPVHEFITRGMIYYRSYVANLFEPLHHLKWTLNQTFAKIAKSFRIQECIDNGVDVINMPFDGGDVNKALSDKITKAVKVYGITIVSGTANRNDILSGVSAHEDVIAVGGYMMDALVKKRWEGYTVSTGSDILTYQGSCWKPRLNPITGNYGGVDIVDSATISHDVFEFLKDLAPTSYIFDIVTDITIFHGTSWATSRVASTVTQMLVQNPNLTPELCRNILRSTATEVGGYDYTMPTTSLYGFPSELGWNEEMGYGQCNTVEAINAAEDN